MQLQARSVVLWTVLALECGVSGHIRNRAYPLQRAESGSSCQSSRDCRSPSDEVTRSPGAQRPSGPDRAKLSAFSRPVRIRYASTPSSRQKFDARSLTAVQSLRRRDCTNVMLGSWWRKSRDRNSAHEHNGLSDGQDKMASYGSSFETSGPQGDGEESPLVEEGGQHAENSIDDRG